MATKKPETRAVIDYEGVEVAYDPSRVTDWAWQHSMAKDPLSQLRAFDELFLGESDAVARSLADAGLAPDGTMGAMDSLIQAILKRVGQGN